MVFPKKIEFFKVAQGDKNTVEYVSNGIAPYKYFSNLWGFSGEKLETF